MWREIKTGRFLKSGIIDSFFEIMHNMLGILVHL
jgi:hypothetical protein